MSVGTHNVIVTAHYIFELALPSFLTELKGRDTDQYTSITTIATFFSSVTATTLQISYSISPLTKLLAVINLIWFLSLVFSVSAGVSSLLGLMWRKSPLYVFLHIYALDDFMQMNS